MAAATPIPPTRTSSPSPQESPADRKARKAAERRARADEARARKQAKAEAKARAKQDKAAARQARKAERRAARAGSPPTPGDASGEGPAADGTMSLMEHLVELRNRLLWTVVFFVIAFFVCFAVAQQIYDFLVQPLAEIMERVGGSRRMIYTALTEAFFTYVKVGAFGAAVLTFPLFANQMWLFIAPGLYRTEKQAVLPFLVISPVLFLAGGAMVYYLVMPTAWEFLLGFQTTQGETVLPIELEAKVGEYLGLVMKLILAFGLGFQLPVALTLMARAGLVRSRTLAEGRKYAVVGVFIAAAIVTPPDVISQILLALPMLVLYEVAIIASRLVEKQRGDADADDLGSLDDDAPEDDPEDAPPATAADGDGPAPRGARAAAVAASAAALEAEGATATAGTTAAGPEPAPTPATTAPGERASEAEIPSPGDPDDDLAEGLAEGRTVAGVEETDWNETR